MTNIDTEQEAFLSHYGKKGMKWGVRKSRSSSSSDRTTYKKSPKQLSDAELGRRIKRMELEKKYSEMNSKKTSRGRQFATSTIENTGRSAISAVGVGAATFFVQRALRQRFGTG